MNNPDLTIPRYGLMPGDLVFARDGVDPLPWEPIAQSMTCLRDELRRREIQGESSDADLYQPIEVGDIDSYKRIYTYEECRVLAGYIGRYTLDILRLKQFPPGEKTQTIIRSPLWFRGCGVDEFVVVEEVTTELLRDLH